MTTTSRRSWRGWRRGRRERYHTCECVSGNTTVRGSLKCGGGSSSSSGGSACRWTRRWTAVWRADGALRQLRGFTSCLRLEKGAGPSSRLSNQTGSCCSHVPLMKQLFQKILCKHQSDVAFVWVKFPIKQEIKRCFLNSCNRSSFLCSSQINIKTKETQPKALRIWKPLFKY